MAKRKPNDDIQYHEFRVRVRCRGAIDKIHLGISLEQTLEEVIEDSPELLKYVGDTGEIEQIIITLP